MEFLSRGACSEGMHLGPLHIQTPSRHFDDTLWFLNSNLHQEPWGFLNYPLDTEALRNGMATLGYAAGNLPDGPIFDLPNCDSLQAPTQLSSLFAQNAQAHMHDFAISLSGACWQHILQTKQVGAYLPGYLENATFDITIITETSA
jgi:predicted component of type VI protein secretion system